MNLREVPRLVWVLAAGRFFSSTSSYLMLFLTLYLTGPRDLSVTTAGLIVGGSGAGLLLGSFTGGKWGDRFGHRPVLLLTSTIGGLATVAVPWAPTWAVAAALPVIAYLGATQGVSTGALAALAVDRGDRRTAIAISRAASNAGFVLGPPLGALIITLGSDGGGWTALFVVEGLMTLLVRFLVAPFLPRENRYRAAHADGPKPAGMLRALRADPALVVLLPAIVLVDLVYRQLYTTVPLHLRDAGESVALYATLNAIGSGLILLLEIPVALRLRRRSSYSIMAVGYALVGLGFALFGLPVTVVTAVLAMVVLTAGEILYKTTATAHVLDQAPDHLVGQYQGLYTGAATSGTLLAGPVGTAVYAAAPTLLWPLCGVAGLVAAAMVLWSRRLAEH